MRQRGGLRRFRGWDGKSQGTIAPSALAAIKQKVNDRAVRWLRGAGRVRVWPVRGAAGLLPAVRAGRRGTERVPSRR